jgi:hypothetical protein
MELRISSPHVGAYSRSTEPGYMVAEELKWVDGELATARTEFLERLYDHQRPLIDELMAEHGVPNEQREHSILPSFAPMSRVAGHSQANLGRL